MGLPIQITFDCRDADRMSEFWALALDYTLQPPPAGFDTWEAFLDANEIPRPDPGSVSAVVDPDEKGPRLLFLRVPEGKVAKKPKSKGKVAKGRAGVDVGGKRKGAGRKPKHDRAGVSHRRREDVTRHLPVHVTMKLRKGLPSLRRRRESKALFGVFAKVREGAGFRVTQLRPVF